MTLDFARFLSGLSQTEVLGSISIEDWNCVFRQKKTTASPRLTSNFEIPDSKSLLEKETELQIQVPKKKLALLMAGTLASMAERFNIKPCSILCNQYSGFKWLESKLGVVETRGEEDYLGKRQVWDQINVEPALVQPRKSKNLNTACYSHSTPKLGPQSENSEHSEEEGKISINLKKTSQCLSDTSTIDFFPLIETLSEPRISPPRVQKKRLIQQKLRYIVSESFGCTSSIII